MAEFYQVDDDNFIIPREVYRVKRGPTVPAAEDGSTEEQESCLLFIKGEATPLEVKRKPEQVVEELEEDND